MSDAPLSLHGYLRLPPDLDAMSMSRALCDLCYVLCLNRASFTNWWFYITMFGWENEPHDIEYQDLIKEKTKLHSLLHNVDIGFLGKDPYPCVPWIEPSPRNNFPDVGPRYSIPRICAVIICLMDSEVPDKSSVAKTTCALECQKDKKYGSGFSTFEKSTHICKSDLSLPRIKVACHSSS